ncbi:MAG: hypothetical protein ACOCUH_02695 [Bacteriovoracia bacterium]
MKFFIGIIFIFFLIEGIWSPRHLSLKHFYKYKSKPQWQKKVEKHYLKTMGKDSNNKVVLYYLLGSRLRISKEIKEDHKICGIYHLFTPSALHFSALLILFKLLLSLKIVRRKKTVIWKWILGLIAFCLMFIAPHLHSLKRAAIFKFFNSYKYLPANAVLYISFAIDLLIGNFQQSPFSYLYSFLFWFVLLNTPKLHYLPLSLWFGNYILGYFAASKVYWGAIFTNFFLTPLFTLVYPLMFILFWLGHFIWNKFFFMVQWWFDIFIYLVKSMSQANEFLGYTYADVMGVFLIGLFISVTFIKMKQIIALIWISSLSLPLGNLKERELSFPSKYFSQASASVQCNYQLIDFFYQLKCKKRPSQ